jgi:hypothetical protein
MSNFFRDITPCSQLKANRHFGETYCLHMQGQISEEGYQRESRWQAYSILKLESIYSSETTVDFQQTTRHCNPEDSTFHNYRCENLKSYRDKSFQLYKKDVICSLIRTNYKTALTVKLLADNIWHHAAQIQVRKSVNCCPTYLPSHKQQSND